MAGKPSPQPNYHLTQINQPTLAGTRKPRRLGGPGLRSFYSRELGLGEMPNLRGHGIVPR